MGTIITILSIWTICIIFGVGGCTLEKKGFTKPAFWALYGYIFAVIHMAIIARM